MERFPIIYQLYLAYIVGTVDAYNQQNGNRLYPQMVIASHILAHQYIISERLLYQALEATDVFL